MNKDDLENLKKYFCMFLDEVYLSLGNAPAPSLRVRKDGEISKYKSESQIKDTTTELFRLIDLGWTMKEIAAKLNVSVGYAHFLKRRQISKSHRPDKISRKSLNGLSQRSEILHS